MSRTDMIVMSRYKEDLEPTHWSAVVSWMDDMAFDLCLGEMFTRLKHLAPEVPCSNLSKWALNWLPAEIIHIQWSRSAQNGKLLASSIRRFRIDNVCLHEEVRCSNCCMYLFYIFAIMSHAFFLNSIRQALSSSETVRPYINLSTPNKLVFISFDKVHTSVFVFSPQQTDFSFSYTLLNTCFNSLVPSRSE